MVWLYLICTVIGFVIYVKWRQSYWQRRGVVFEEPEFFFGSTRNVMSSKISSGDDVLERYNKAKKLSTPYIGLYRFMIPILFFVDPVLIKHVMVIDFNYFMDRGMYHHPDDVLTMNLVRMEGRKWRELRTKLTPTFTSGKMKMMFETFADKSEVLKDVVGEYADKAEAMNVKEVLARFTTDIIASCGFGIECNSLTEPSNEFRRYGKKALEASIRRFFFLLLPTSLMHGLGVKLNTNDVSEFFSSIVKQTIKTREDNNIVRKDFMNLMLQLKNETFSSENAMFDNQDETKKPLSESEIIGQCFIFFLAGYETSSTAMTFACLELAQNVQIQEKLRNEIVEVLQRHDGKITYDAIMDMPYLDKVVNETLRKYPPIPSVPRVCKKDYTIPNTGLTIQKGTTVLIPIFGMHRDPEYYPKPEVFDPERFSPQQIAQRPEFTFIPFGEGPRVCIGLRFGLLQTKLGLVCLLKNYRLALNRKTSLPIELEKNNAVSVLSVRGDVWLDVTKV